MWKERRSLLGYKRYLGAEGKDEMKMDEDGTMVDPGYRVDGRTPAADGAGLRPHQVPAAGG